MASSVAAQDFERYLGEARSWETDRLVTASRSTRTAWTVALAASGIALTAVIAVVGLTPLKQTELRIIRVDNVTGLVDVLSELPDAKTNYSEAVNKYFAQLYIRFREGYSKELATDYYNSVGLMSAGAEQRRYFDSFNPKNPLSPLNIYGDNARVRVRVKSVSFIKANVALVRYVREIERGASERPAVSHWAATMVFKYSGAPQPEKDRAVNPLGFLVTEYRNDPDTSAGDLTSPASQATPPAGSPASAPPQGVVLFPGVASVPVPGQVPAIAPSASGQE